MELAAHGDLLDYVKLRGALSERDCKFFFKQLVSGMEYLHGLNIVHRLYLTVTVIFYTQFLITFP